MSQSVLWCGGSHLATAHEEILKVSYQHGIQSDFFITAGGAIAKWSTEGGEWKVFDDHFITGYIDKRLSYSLRGTVNVSLYDTVIFIGQYIQPSRVFQPGFDWTLASEGVLRAVIRNSFIQSPHPTFARTVNNNIITIFKEVKNSNCKVILFADPFVHIKSRTENNPYYVTDIDYALKNFYYRELFKWARENDITAIFQDKSTYDPIKWATYTNFILDPMEDDFHMTTDFWRLNIQKLILPLICKDNK